MASEIASPHETNGPKEPRGVPWIITTPGAVAEGILGILWWCIPFWWLLRFSPPLALGVFVGTIVLTGAWAWWKHRARLRYSERRRAWRAEQKRRREQARAARASSRGLQN